MRVLIFGDSITQGFFDSKGGWANRLASDYHMASLKKRLEIPSSDTVQVFNLGITANKVPDVLERFEDELRVREDEGNTIIVFAIGINDARHENRRAVTDVYQFQEAFENLLDKARKRSAKVLCVGLSAVDESQTSPWPYRDGNLEWGNNRINLFEDTIKQSAFRKHVPFAPVHDRFLAELEAGNELLADGLHPNDQGHELIAALVKPELDRLLQ